VNMGPGRRHEGIDLVKAIRSQPGSQDAFVAVYSGLVDARAERARRAGADIFLSKADLRADLNTIVGEWLLRTNSESHDTRQEPTAKDDPSLSLGSDLWYPGLVDANGQPVSTDSPVAKAIVEVITSANVEILQLADRNPQLLWSISPRQFEELVAEILNRFGYQATLTPESKDGGVDILAARKDALGEFLCLVECKRYVPPNKVGVALVRSLHGVLEKTRATAAMLVTTSYFTRDAQEFQQDLMHRLHLRDYIALKSWLKQLRNPKSM
jgi:CheY-like chemotaxis protein